MTLPPRGSRMFWLIVLVALGLYVMIGLMVLAMQIRPGFMGMAHGTLPHHRVHDLTFALIMAAGASGLIAQLRAPARNIAGQLMALIPWIALLLAFSLATTWLLFAPAPILGALALAATILHPARDDFSRSLSFTRVDRGMLTLMIVAALPLLAMAYRNIALQRALDSDHATLGHYGFMAAFSLTVLGIAALASLRPVGWRLAAWTAGALPAVLGVLSLSYPTNDSSLNSRWASAAIAWGLAFITVALRGNDYTAPAADAVGVLAREGGREPRSRKVFAVVAIALGALLVVMHLAAGGGPASRGDTTRHAPR